MTPESGAAASFGVEQGYPVMEQLPPLCHQVTVRLSEDDYRRLQAFGARRGLRLPQLLRSSALERVLAEESAGRGA